MAVTDSICLAHGATASSSRLRCLAGVAQEHRSGCELCRRQDEQYSQRTHRMPSGRTKASLNFFASRCRFPGTPRLAEPLRRRAKRVAERRSTPLVESAQALTARSSRCTLRGRSETTQYAQTLHRGLLVCDVTAPGVARRVASLFAGKHQGFDWARFCSRTSLGLPSMSEGGELLLLVTEEKQKLFRLHNQNTDARVAECFASQAHALTAELSSMAASKAEFLGL